MQFPDSIQFPFLLSFWKSSDVRRNFRRVSRFSRLSYFQSTRRTSPSRLLDVRRLSITFGKNISAQDSISRLGPVSIFAFLSFWKSSDVRRNFRRVSRFSRLSYFQSTRRTSPSRLLNSFWTSEDFLLFFGKTFPPRIQFPDSVRFPFLLSFCKSSDVRRNFRRVLGFHRLSYFQSTASVTLLLKVLLFNK